MSQKEARNVACRLLADSERAVPLWVVKTVAFFVSNGLWFLLSRNGEATSCADAARKRRRLGSVGIELWKELKTFYGKWTDESGRERFFLAHCRGDRSINLGLVRKALGARSNPTRVGEDEINVKGLRFGEINPFVFARDPDVVQLFDTELFAPFGNPNTVMTNAGDRTWGIEFNINELVGKIRDMRAVPIVNDEPVVRYGSGRGDYTIAIITGNAPESGMLLLQRILDRVRRVLGSRCSGDISLPRIQLVSAPFLGMTMELAERKDEISEQLEKLVEETCATKPTVLALACNTTHHFTPQIRKICSRHGVGFISMPEVVGGWLRAKGIGRAALLGIPYVADFKKGLSAYKAALRDIETVSVPSDVLEQVAAIAYEVKREGATRKGLQKLRMYLNGIEADHIIVALTELSLLLALEKESERTRARKVLVDPVQLYAEALADGFIGPGVFTTI